MRILLLGAYGFIGSAVARALLADGHAVTGLGRDLAYGRRLLPAVNWIAADLDRMTAPSDWHMALEGIDAVVNASGLLQSGDGGAVARVQGDAILALAVACVARDIRRFVQISAAGAHRDAGSDFLTSKAATDGRLAAMPLDCVILRPGLVIDRNCYGGTELIRMIAALPLVTPRLAFAGTIQCVAMADVVAAVQMALTAQPPTQPVDLVAAEANSLDRVIATHRRWLGLPPARWRPFVPLPLVTLASRTADLLGRFGWRSPLRRNALLALTDGVHGDVAQTRRWLGHEPLSLDQTLARHPAGKQDRLFALMGLLLLPMLLALGLMWSLSGLATLARLDEAALILHVAGLPPPFDRWLAAGGALADLALAAMLLWRRRARAALLGMVGLTLVYLALGTLLLPGLWADPLAPYAKTLPALMLALVAWPMLAKR